MRIISGELGGRVFDSPGTAKTHPMSERVRGALFNVLGDITGLTVLDAFAGSGAVSFEAVSRGATHALAIESDQIAQKIIARNIAELRLTGKVKLIKASAGAWLRTDPEATFDVVLCDSPYNDPQLSLLKNLAERVKVGGIFTCSLPPNCQLDLPTTNYELQTIKNYGDAQLTFWRKRLTEESEVQKTHSV